MLLAGIIPRDLFVGLGEGSELWLWLIAAGAVGMLVFGADRAVSAAAGLAAALGMSKVLIGATVVSLGTTSPEAAVSVNAAIQGDGGLALGNGVGSIICDTALIFGLCCCLARLPKDRFVLNRQGWLQLGSGVLLVCVCLLLAGAAGGFGGPVIPRWVGLGFLVLLAGYLAMSVHWARRRPGRAARVVDLAAHEGEAASAEGAGRRPRRKATTVAMLVGGLALVVLGSELLIGSMRVIAERHHVPRAVIAATLVAFGTSLPELVTALTAVAKGHSELLVGNVIGADILNVLFVIGASATATPLRVDAVFFYFLFPVMLLVLAMLRVFIFLPGRTFRRWQGVPLLAAYAAFVALTLILNAGD